MENVHQPELWHDFFVVLGSSSAALIGLLFIATSLHLGEIVNDPILRRRAFNNTLFLLMTFVAALLVLIPQPMPILGAELVVINLLGLWPELRFVYIFFKSKEDYHRSGGAIHRAITFIVGFLLGIAGGAALIGYLNWGIYLVAISYIIVLGRVVLSAWAIMVGVGQLEKATKAN